MTTGIKETKELLDGVEVIVKFAAKVAEDKKVNAEDFPALVELAKQFETIVAAGKDADQVKEELKDLDEAEIVGLIVKIHKIAKSFKA